MNCEEFAKASLNGELYSGDGDTTKVREHLRACPGCAALFESLLSLKAELRDLGHHTSQSEAPSRVEMRLRQEFRTVHHTGKMHGRALMGGWLLAAATLVLGVVSWTNWRPTIHTGVAKGSPTATVVVPATPTGSGTTAVPQETVLIADNGTDEFALLPGSMPGSLEDSAVVRVQMQRGALGAFGLTVNEEHASDVVQVDLLVGSDGQPQGYRLPQTTN
jgi:anti-sigma factor RsiW